MMILYRKTNGQLREIQADGKKVAALVGKGWTKKKPGEEKPKRTRKPKTEE